MTLAKPPRSSGNALFLILIAVALFAALAYAVTQSGRGGGSIDREQAVLLGAQIVPQAASIQATVQRMLLTGTTVANLDFCSDVINNQCGHYQPSVDACSSGADCVFAPEGGGAVAPTIPAAAFNTALVPPLRRWNYVTGYSFTGVGTSAADPVVFTCGISLPVCESINRGLGESPTPPVFNAFALGMLCTLPEISAGPLNLPVACPDCVGKSALCVSGGGSAYAYYTYLAER